MFDEVLVLRFLHILRFGRPAWNELRVGHEAQGIPAKSGLHQFVDRVVERRFIGEYRDGFTFLVNLVVTRFRLVFIHLFLPQPPCSLKKAN